MQLAWRSSSDLPIDESESHADIEIDAQSQNELATVARAQIDPRAFAPLYEHYGPIIYHYCLRRLSHPEIAADAASVVFVKAIGALPRFRPDPRRQGSTFRSWLFTIAHNVVVDFRRRDRGHLSLEANDAALARSPNLIDQATTPEESAMANESARQLHELLHLLPDRQRAVLELRLSGLTGSEIARILEMSESAVKSVQFRAYATLRTELHNDERIQRETSR